MPPVIGITSSIPNDVAPADFEALWPYMLSVREAGGEPLALRNDREQIEAYLGQVDGLLFSGGADVAAELYGGRAELIEKTNPARDAFELTLVREARARAIPTLCICRGLQLANVAFGGTLIEDLRTEFGDEQYLIKHRQTKDNGQERTEYGIDHDVQVEPSSALAHLLGTTRFPTNSLHHQAVREPAADLRAVAWTNDNVIEALDARFEHPFFYCVQWHPEELMPHDPPSLRLFEALVTVSAREAARGAALDRA
ncbi:MAG TPA: gamma-glutamyl-gamma-aminobutyrate hydrolase family protein [Candidatus Acidoferrales bacterium]|nr:gamma-glutamyl-gamma-aminobutyrate hydrolase family protein [Candidatus Acidoferrales bacterium]